MAPKETPENNTQSGGLGKFTPDANLKFPPSPPLSDVEPFRIDRRLATVGRDLPVSRFSPGQKIFESLSDEEKLQALLGQLPDDFFENPKDKQALDRYIRESGLTADSYFPERVQAVKKAFDDAGVQYDDDKTSDENFNDLVSVYGDLVQGRMPFEQVDMVEQAVEEFPEIAEGRPSGLEQKVKTAITNLGVDVAELLPFVQDYDFSQTTTTGDKPPYVGATMARPGQEPSETADTPDYSNMPAGAAQGPPNALAAAINKFYAELSPEERELFEANGFGHGFLNYRQDQGDLVIGLLDGIPVPYDTPGATQIFLVDYVETREIVDQADINYLFDFTEYAVTASVATQEWEKTYYNAPENSAERDDMLADAREIFEDLELYFGVDLSPDLVDELAFEASRLNMLEDDEYLVQAVVGAVEYDIMQSETSASVRMANQIRQMARTYFTDIPESQAREWVIEINSGNATIEDYEYLIRQQAMARFPELAGFIGDGRTVAGYFATHQARMEDMLGRPVDIYREFPQLYQNGIMTEDDAARIVRNTGEWRQSNSGQDAAMMLSTQLAQVFGEVA